MSRESYHFKQIFTPNQNIYAAYWDSESVVLETIIGFEVWVVYNHRNEPSTEYRPITAEPCYGLCHYPSTTSNFLGIISEEDTKRFNLKEFFVLEIREYEKRIRDYMTSLEFED